MDHTLRLNAIGKRLRKHVPKFLKTSIRYFTLISLIHLSFLACDSPSSQSNTRDADVNQEDQSILVTLDQQPPATDLWMVDQNVVDMNATWMPMDALIQDQGVLNDLSMPTHDAMLDALPPPEASVTLQFDTPQDAMTYQIGQSIPISAQIEVQGTTLDYVGLTLTFNESISVPFTLDRSTQTLTATLDAPLQTGRYPLTLTASIFPSYQVSVTHEIIVACESVNAFDQALDARRWQSFGPALLDERGWLELTQNQLHVQGGIFWIGETIQAGDLDIEFDFSTSKCQEPGVCMIDRINAGGGFAVNFWNLAPSQIEGYWEVMRGLGHHTPPHFLEENALERLESFHVVFDTYSNSCDRCGMQAPFDGCGNAHYEPTHTNHVAIYRDGYGAIHGQPDEMGSYCYLGIPDENWNSYWASFPQMDDGTWHHVHISIQSTRITVRIDEQDLIDFQLPTFSFKGGILSFSAGSGVNGNFHRIDQLRVNQLCQQ